jgi:CheY-like chemotaxis protein
MSQLDCPELHGTRVLVVDDDIENREMLATVLEGSGARVAMAGSAAEALIAFQNDRPQVVLLDLGLPDEDGFILLKRLRALPMSDGEVLAIALTGYGSPEDRDQTRGAGFRAHLTKPFGLSEMLDSVVQVLRSRPRADLL